MSDSKKELENIARNVWLFGLGTVATIEEETTRLSHQIKQTGSKIKSQTEEFTQKTIDDTVKVAEDLQYKMLKKVDEVVENTVNTVGIPSHKQVRDLTSKIDEMTKKVEMIKKRMSKR